MTALTVDAQELYDRYLKTVRWSVRGIPDADEIERDVREHVDTALEQVEQPVSSQMLRGVLARLGDPWQWVPVEELPWWRRVLMRFSVSPEDWRLAYLCFALTMVGIVLVPIGIGVLLLMGAFLLARATYELASDRDGTLGPRRWLVYPPLVLFSALLVFGLLVGPAGPLVVFGIGERGFGHALENLSGPGFLFVREVADLGAAAVVIGSWWVVLSLIAAIAIRPLRWLVVPFANRLRRVHLLWLTAIGAALIALGVAPFLISS